MEITRFKTRGLLLSVKIIKIVEELMRNAPNNIVGIIKNKMKFFFLNNNPDTMKFSKFLMEKKPQQTVYQMN